MFLSMAILFGGMILFSADSARAKDDGITGSCDDELGACEFKCGGCGAKHAAVNSIAAGPASNLKGSCRACGYTY